MRTLTRMKTWEALSTLILARNGISNREIFNVKLLELSAKKALREIGMTSSEMDAEFPEFMLREMEDLSRFDPEEFDRQTDKAMEWYFSRN